MIKIIVDKIPKEAKECPFAEYIAMTNKHCCMFQNNTDKKQVIEKGERVMQGIFMPFLIADNDEAVSERLGGIGSSGK